MNFEVIQIFTIICTIAGLSNNDCIKQAKQGKLSRFYSPIASFILLVSDDVWSNPRAWKFLFYKNIGWNNLYNHHKFNNG